MQLFNSCNNIASSDDASLMSIDWNDEARNTSELNWQGSGNVSSMNHTHRECVCGGEYLKKKKLALSQHKVTEVTSTNVILNAHKGLKCHKDKPETLLHLSESCRSLAEAALQKSSPPSFSRGSFSSTLLCSVRSTNSF